MQRLLCAANDGVEVFRSSGRQDNPAQAQRVEVSAAQRSITGRLTTQIPGGPDPFVRIDMEGSDYTQRTLDLFCQLWDGQYRNVGVVIQSYLRRSAEDIEKLIQYGARVRLCKGAYKEPASVAFPEKADVDANYVRLMRRLLQDGNYPGIATHDEKVIAATKTFAAEQNIAADRYEFQMLYGIRRDLQAQLVSDGYRLRVYTPFGTFWYPYLMRRLAERPANLWFVAKNMLRS